MHFSVIALITAALSAAAFPIDPFTSWQTNQQSVANQIRYNNLQLQFNSFKQMLSSMAAQQQMPVTSTSSQPTSTSSATTTNGIANLRFAVVATSSGVPIYQVTSLGGSAYTLATGTEGVTTTFAGHTFTVVSPTPTSESSSGSSSASTTTTTSAPSSTSTSTGSSSSSSGSSSVSSTRSSSASTTTSTAPASSASHTSSASSSSSSSSSHSSTSTSSSSSPSTSPQNLNVKNSADGAMSGRVGLAHFAGVLGGIVAGALMVV